MNPSWDQTADPEEVYGGASGMAKAFAAGAGRGASFGASDQALVKSGIALPETLKNLQETNPVSSALGEIAGIVGPALLGNESGALNLPKTIGKLGSKVSEAAGEKGAGRILSETIGRGTEGAAYGLGQSISENALGDHDLISEKTLANMGLSAAFLGGVPEIVGQAGKMAGKAISSDFLSKGLEYLSYVEKIKNPIKILTGVGIADTVGSALKTGKSLIKALGPEGQAKLKTLINLGDEAGEVDKSISSKIKAFISNSSEPIAAKEAASALSKADFDDEEKNIVDNVMNAPQLTQKFDENMGGLDQHAPNVSNGMKMGFIRGMQFLNSKLPQRPMDAFGNRPDIAMSDIQKFSRYRSIVENPVSALDQIKDKTLSPESTEALSAVYPKLFENMRQELVNQMANRKNKVIPFQTRQMISQFLGEPMEKSLSGQSILANQAILSNAPKPNQPMQAQSQMKTRAKGLDKIARADRAANDYSAMDEKV